MVLRQSFFALGSLQVTKFKELARKQSVLSLPGNVTYLLLFSDLFSLVRIISTPWCMACFGVFGCLS